MTPWRPRACGPSGPLRIRRFELWRLLTNVLFFGRFGMGVWAMFERVSGRTRSVVSPCIRSSCSVGTRRACATAVRSGWGGGRACMLVGGMHALTGDCRSGGKRNGPFVLSRGVRNCFVGPMIPRLCLPHGFRTVPAMIHILSKLVLPRSFDFFFHMFFLVKYSNELEEEDFR
jgi:hypothetical protein